MKPEETRLGFKVPAGETNAAIVEGSTVFEWRPTMGEFPVPWRVEALAHNKMDWKCDCGDPRCTRKKTWTAKVTGQHPDG